MISLKVPLGEEKTWLVVHDLAVAREGESAPIRPIHLLTFIGTELSVKDPVAFVRLLHRLEIKLFAVTQWPRAGERLRRGGRSAPGRPRLQDYELEAVFVHARAVPRAIHDALEIAAALAGALDKRLPKGFRLQGRKFAPFGFDKNPWLRHFFDVRYEVSAFDNALPYVEPPNVMIEFPAPRELLLFRTGRHAVPLSEIIEYEEKLLELLDRWALGPVRSIDPDAVVQRHVEEPETRTTRIVRVPVSELLARMTEGAAP